jgi:hypothetical protein
MLLEVLSYYVHDAGIYTGCFVWKWFNSIFFIFVFVLFFLIRGRFSFSLSAEATFLPVLLKVD